MYVIGLAANRFIVKDTKLITNLRLTKSTIKGIGDIATEIKGIWSTTIKLESDDERHDSTEIHYDVYAPFSPCNLFPPHLLIARTKALGYIVHQSFHDDLEYIFNYRLPAERFTNMRHLATPVGSNKLFHFYTRNGFTVFFKRAKHYAPSFTPFTGEVHIIQHDAESLTDTYIYTLVSRGIISILPSRYHLIQRGIHMTKRGRLPQQMAPHDLHWLSSFIKTHTLIISKQQEL